MTAGNLGRFSPPTARLFAHNHLARMTAGMNALRFAPHTTTEAANHSGDRTLPPNRSNANLTRARAHPFALALSPVQAKIRRVHPDANN